MNSGGSLLIIELPKPRVLRLNYNGRTKTKRSKYTKTQIVLILKEVEGGWMVKKLYRDISDATYYNWIHGRMENNTSVILLGMKNK